MYLCRVEQKHIKMETTFKQISEVVSKRFSDMQSQGKLFRSALTGHDLWDTYILNFEKGDNPIFRDPESSSHNDNLDRAFIKRYGNIVALTDELEVITMWDNALPGVYLKPFAAMSKALKEAAIADIFVESFNELNNLPYEKCTKTQPTYKLGIAKNNKIYTQQEADMFGVVTAGEVYSFYHFNADLKRDFLDFTDKSVASLLSTARADKEVFKRLLDEVSVETFETVRDLLLQGSLLDGAVHTYKIDSILPLAKHYAKLEDKDKDSWAWLVSKNLAFAKLRNELIGVFCVDIQEGVDLTEACRTWNKRVDPANYMKAKSPITKRQVEEAEKFAEKEGYLESFNRRAATLADIDINEILHCNSDSKKASIFDKVKTKTGPSKDFNKVEEVTIEKFMTDILPTCTKVSALVENRLEGNLVALTTSDDKDSKKMFKWDNNYSWTYKGNLAGRSQIKENVKKAGGAVDGDVRFSIMWADANGDNSDLDAHCTEPNSHTIYYGSKVSKHTGGNLDIDITQPGGKLSVENITYPSKSKMTEGTYTFQVNNYAFRNSQGFSAEVEIEGTIYQYTYDKPLQGTVEVAKVTYKDGAFTIKHLLPFTSEAVSKEVWGIKTEEFQKVNLVSLSPNFWGENNVGNKHYMFMLDKCTPSEKIRTFHTENLNEDLVPHRKVLDTLGNTTMVEPVANALCGLGFNATVKDSVTLKIEGSFNRIIKVIFNN